MTKNVLILLALLLGIGGGIFIAQKYYSFGQTVTRENSQVLLESMREVAKVIAVEGNFSEIYSHEDYYSFDIVAFRKKALLRVEAKVSVGYNLENMQITADDTARKIIISNLPQPEILSVDHDIDYYDIQEGAFNSFTPKEFSDINARAKQFIEEKVKSDGSYLFNAAEKQKNRMLETLGILAQTAGYELIYEASAGAILRDKMREK